MQWYYVENKERVGPVSQPELMKLIESNILGPEHFVWAKGYENWKKIKDVETLQVKKVSNKISLKSLSDDDKRIYIRTGADRGGGVATDYGPFSLNLIKNLYKENRINGKTLIYFQGLTNWTYLADMSDFQEIFQELPPSIEQVDRRSAQRKPFIARLLVSDQKGVFEGICRDVSIGGMQVLVANFPAKLGDKISLNVHPENTDYHFAASGTIVRILEGSQGFSFRFATLSTEAKKAIESYIEKES